MPIYYVYQLVDPITNLPFYIGKGKNTRANTHLWGTSKSNNPRKDKKILEIRAAGYEPIIQYLYENLTQDDAYLKEEQLIAQFGRVDFDKNGILVNIKKDAKPPSQKGKKRIFTDEHRKKLSDSLKGKSKNVAPWNKGLTKDTDSRVAISATTRSNTGNFHQLGIKHSPERIEKVKNKLVGRKMSDEQKLKMSVAKKGKTWEEIYGVAGAESRRQGRIIKK